MHVWESWCRRRVSQPVPPFPSSPGRWALWGEEGGDGGGAPRAPVIAPSNSPPPSSPALSKQNRQSRPPEPPPISCFNGAEPPVPSALPARCRDRWPHNLPAVSSLSFANTHDLISSPMALARGGGTALPTCDRGRVTLVWAQRWCHGAARERPRFTCLCLSRMFPKSR